MLAELNKTMQNEPGTSARQRMRDAQAKINQAKAYRRELGELLLREMTIRPKLFPSKSQENGVKKDPDDSNLSELQAPEHTRNSASKTALTLYGSAPTPRQLFSSIQIPKAHQSSITPIREIALPNGIATTNIVPVHSSTAGSEKKLQTLGDLLPQPPSLAQLNPPRQSRHTATRSSSVNWYSASESTPSTRNYRRDNYSTQAMTAPQWLLYNATPSAARMSSPEAKRKQRDRALSFGEPQSTISQESMDAHNQAKDEALFRSAFSSFAPDRDSTGATVNARTKNRVWWEKIGEAKYQQALLYASNEDDEEFEPALNGESAADADHEMTLIEEAVASWTSEENPEGLKEAEQISKEPTTANEVDDILNEISELLETLNSYQRVRNLSLATNARTTAGQNPQLTAMSGTPTSPSTAEFDVYEMLKSQLTVMISMLPPVAVARLDGDKLAALNVSTKILTEGTTVRGTLEEDDVTLRTRQAATPAAYPRPGTAASALPARSNPYATTPVQQTQRSNYASQPSASRPSSTYLPNQQYSNRPISSNQYYGNASSAMPTQQRAPANPDRYSYASSQQYNQQSSRTPNTGYANGYRTPAVPNAPSYSQQYATPSQGSSGSTAYSQAQRPSQPGYQQRAMNSQAYSYVSASAGRSASPQQAASTYTPQQRSSYTANNPTAQQPRPPMYQSQSSQYGGQPAPTPQVNGTGVNGSATPSTTSIANDAAALMNRQKAPLAEQQRQSPSRPPSSTPQPANGNQMGAPSPLSNGVAAG